MSVRPARNTWNSVGLIAAIVLLAAAGWVQAQETTAPGLPPEVSTLRAIAVGNRTAADASDDVVAVDELEAPAVDAASSLQTSSGAKSVTQKVVKDPAMELTDPRTYRLKILLKVEAPDGKLTNVVAVEPIPMDWPEQQVRLISQKLSAGARVTQEVIPGQAAVLRLQVATIPQGGSATVERLYEVTRHRMQFKMPPDELDRPHRPPAELRDALTGPAPGLETQHPKIVALAESLRHRAVNQGSWDMVKGFWQWTRDNVKFENGDFRGALFAVENKCGDCEEMSALFVSLCRLSNITARTVWVEGHDYPEFYLSDRQGVGHWIPAQVVGPPWFGEMAEYRPIFQKGDRFYDRFQKQYTRYVPHTARADGSSTQPKLIVDHQIISDTDINDPSYNSTK
ncbi:MAG TPA: transglutaminase-like domain-containing protein [Pirellulales bacterium]